MIELKSKKTGRVSIETDESYAKMLKVNPELVKRFIVTQLKSRPIVPSLKQEVPLELKKNKKHEG